MSFAQRYAQRLFLSMSLEQAREILGFPPSYAPSPSEIQKAYRSKAIANHPDRGGDHRKMVEINVAKEILEGKRHDRFIPQPPPVDPQKELDRKRQAAFAAIDRAAAEVFRSVESAIQSANITKGRIHLREFFTDDLADAVDKIQDSIERSKADHADIRKADALCQSLSNKALRLSKKYLTLMKKQGELVAGMTGMGDPVTVNSMTALYAEVTSFISAFEAIYVDSSKLVTLINTSDNVPYEWDDVYHRTHQIILAFKDDFRRFGTGELGKLQKAIGNALQMMADPILAIAPDAWKKVPSADDFAYPHDFDALREAVKKASIKNASLADRVASRYKNG